MPLFYGYCELGNTFLSYTVCDYGCSLCVFKHLSAQCKRQLYLSSILKTTTSSGTLWLYGLWLCSLGLSVCVCVCVAADCTICTLEFRIYLWITHICCPQLLRLQITITQTLPPPQHSAPRVCVCVFAYYFCGKHSHRSIH